MLKTSSPKKKLKASRSWTPSTIKEHLADIFTSASCDNDVPKQLRQIFEECRESEECLKAVFQECTETLDNQQLHSKVAQETMGKLKGEVETLTGATMVELAEDIIKALKDGSHSSLELFPKLLFSISSHKIIKYRNADGSRCGELGGVEHRDHLFNSLISCRWPQGSILSIIETAKEIKMDQDDLKFLIKKVFQVMEDLPLPELPPLVYQLLSLCQEGHRTLVLEGVRELFDRLDKSLTEQQMEDEDSVTVNNEKPFLAAEGTVLVHLSYAVKQNPALRKDYIKLLKASKLWCGDLTLFLLSLALATLTIPKLEDTLLGFFKDHILRSYKDSDRVLASKWLKELTETSADFDTLLMKIVCRSGDGWEGSIHGSGWDQVVEGLLSMAMHLMDTCGPKNNSLSELGTPQMRACALASKLLAEAFKRHGVIRHDLVTRIINSIMMNSTVHVTHYIDLLSTLIKNTSQMDFVDSVPKLKETLSYIAMIPSQAAVQLITAILPLVQFSPSLRDSLLIVLRKSLFSKHLHSRKTAVECYLELLKRFTVLDSVGSVTDSQMSSSVNTQVSVEVHGGNSHGNEGLCLEILHTLKRALTKQYDVKLSLYQGLYAVSKANKQLSGAVLDLLKAHFSLYYEHVTDINPPVKIESCIMISDSSVRATEPLEQLVCCVQMCAALVVDDEEAAAVEGVAEMLSSTATRLIATQLEDLELNKSSDFTSSSVGQRNKLVATIAMGLYETMLDYTFTTGQFSAASLESVLKLYQGYQRVVDVHQDKGGAGSSKKTTPTSSKLSLQCTVDIIKAVFSDQTPNHQQPLTQLRDSQQFIRYVLGVAIEKINQVCQSGHCEGSYHPELLYQQCCTLARLLYKQIEGGSTRASRKEKGKSVPTLCLEGFSQLLQTALSRWGNVESFLTAVSPSLEGSGFLEVLHYYIRQFQRIVAGVLDGSCREWSMKEAQSMVFIIELLTTKLELGSQELEQVFSWVYTQCKDHNIDDPPLTKTLLSLLLVAAERDKTSVKIVRRLATDAHYHLGDVDEDVEFEFTPNFQIVNPRTTKSSVLPLLYAHIDHLLADVDWLVSRLKSEASSSTEDVFGRPTSPVATQSQDTCTAVCDQLGNLVKSVSDMAQSATPVGTIAEGLLKVVTKLYASLSSMAKYVLDIFQFTTNVPASFKKLISLVGSEIYQQVYMFITYIQGKLQTDGSGLVDTGKKGGRAKPRTAKTGTVRKEGKIFSNIVGSIEQLEKFLIQLDKKSKGSLMEPFKHSLSRDFRIIPETLDNILEDEDDDQEDELPSAKRMKTNEQ